MVNLDNVEQRINSYIEEHSSDLVELCSKLIQFNSENPPGDSVPINKFIETFLKEVNVEMEWHKAGDNMWNLTSSIGSKKGKKLIFCGHTDVVPAGDRNKWEFDPFSGEVKDGWILGRGASDMKGGLAGLVFTTYVLSRLDIELDGELILAIVPDEETGGELGVPWLLNNNLISADGCIIAEPSSPLNPTIGQKGSCWFQLHVYGTQAHGSLAPLAGDNAILHAMKAIEKINKVWDVNVSIPLEAQRLIDVSKEYMKENERSQFIDILEKISVNIGTIHGGTKSNVVPDQCTIEVDCRIPFGITHQDVLNFVKKELNHMEIDYDIEPFGFKSNANYTSPENPVCEAVMDSIGKVTNQPAYGVMQWASSDARHFRTHHIPVLQYGPAYLPSIHNFNEKVKVEDVIRCAKVYAMTALNYLKK
ncbi:M20 family metallopeptidase [Alteribacter populi]|uniref:M20 family metallopeptidase n=1 Tax=Alteribacter populi TaxID=2011011 RepID=UPI000BBA8676|nr:ArgE/DapE family deacylase [Alteribacter populi]